MTYNTDGPARFWVWHRGGWVRLSIRPGASVQHTETVATLDGTARTVTRYTFAAGTVVQAWDTEADGPGGTWQACGEALCAAADLEAVDAYEWIPCEPNRGIRCPAWRYAWREDQPPAGAESGTHPTPF